MKTTLSKILIVLLVLSSVLTIAAAPNNNRIKITPFTGNEHGTGIIDPGTMKFVDGIIITRGLVVGEVDDMTDDRVDGITKVTVNSVYKAPPVGQPPFFGTGPVWGTIHLTNPNKPGGGWNINFEGHQYDGCRSVIHGRGSGEGDYEGLKAVWEWQSADCMFSSTVTGYIIEHE
jgi:hypothetical protein